VRATGERETVVVPGATSYIGSYLIPRLLALGHQVIGVSRRPALGRILFPKESGLLCIASPQEAAERARGTKPVIVNLAYARDAEPHHLYRETRRLVSSISRIAVGGCRLIVHVSTAAVFGDRPAREPGPVRARWRPLDPYAESKIYTEHLLERLAAQVKCDLAIVRLGNVIGPASPNWVAGVAQRIMEGKACGYQGESGFSNATHVFNASSYLTHVLAQTRPSLADWGIYHHLAEFSSTRWPELLDCISDEIGREWTTASRPAASSGAARWSRNLLKSVYRKSAGGYMRAALSMLPESPTVDRVITLARESKRPDPGAMSEAGSEDAHLLEVLSADQEFRSFVLPGWDAEVEFVSACSGIREWLRASGYSLKPVAIGA
jgi:nucleoside-diphosphate-sugar epimerase